MHPFADFRPFPRRRGKVGMEANGPDCIRSRISAPSPASGKAGMGANGAGCIRSVFAPPPPAGGVWLVGGPTGRTAPVREFPPLPPQAGEGWDGGERSGGLSVCEKNVMKRSDSSVGVPAVCVQWLRPCPHPDPPPRAGEGTVQRVLAHPCARNVLFLSSLCASCVGISEGDLSTAHEFATGTPRMLPGSPTSTTPLPPPYRPASAPRCPRC